MLLLYKNKANRSNTKRKSYFHVFYIKDFFSSMVASVPYFLSDLGTAHDRSYYWTHTEHPEKMQGCIADFFSKVYIINLSSFRVSHYTAICNLWLRVQVKHTNKGPLFEAIVFTNKNELWQNKQYLSFPAAKYLVLSSRTHTSLCCNSDIIEIRDVTWSTILGM